MPDRDQKLRVAVVGAGQMANRVHLPSLAMLDDVEICGICDLNSEVLNQTADKYQIKRRYADYRRMVADMNPEAIYVLGQPHILYDVWLWCLQQGLHLYIEKPMGLTMHQARSLAHLAEHHGCITQVSFQRRNSPMYALLLQKVLERGPIIHAVCNFNKSSTGPFLGARDLMMDDCIHAVDTIRWICGGEIVKISSVARRVRVPNINVIIAVLHFDSEATGVIINNEISGRRVFSVEMHGINICAEGELEGKAYLYEKGKEEFRYGTVSGIEYDACEVAGSSENFIFGGYLAKHREFIDCVKNGTLPSSHFGDALKTMEVAETILAQSLLDKCDA